MPRHAPRRRRVEQVGVVLQVARELAADLGQRQHEVELGRAVSTGTGSRRQPGRLGAAAATVCSTNITWNSGVWARSRSSCSVLDQPLERHVVVGEGIERRLAAPAPVARRSPGRPRARARSTTVLTKNPISPSVSAAVAARHRRAHQHVLLPRVARQQRLEAGEQGHEEGRPPLRGRTP